MATAGALPTTPGNDDGDGVVESADEGADASEPCSPPPFAPLDEPLSEAQERAWASAEVSAPDVPAAAAAGLRGKSPEEDEGAESATKEGVDSVTKGADSVGTAAHPVVVTANAQDASRWRRRRRRWTHQQRARRRRQRSSGGERRRRRAISRDGGRSVGSGSGVDGTGHGCDGSHGIVVEGPDEGVDASDGFGRDAPRGR